ncbi:MAG: AAA family ATPase [Methylomonas sp.]
MQNDVNKKLLGFKPDGIPEDLKRIPRWAPWRAEWNAKRGKYDKIPRNPCLPKYGVSTKAPEKWADFNTALGAFNRNPGDFAGLGFCLTGLQGIVAVDLDKCANDGVPDSMALGVINKLNSYTEVSPSGTGFRIVVNGNIDSDWTNHDIGIEVYGGHEARFVTFTGHEFGEGLISSSNIESDRDAALAEIAAAYRKSTNAKSLTATDTSLPELLPLDEITGLMPVLPPDLALFMETGELEAGADRSGLVFRIGIELCKAGLDDAVVFSLLATNDYVMEVALDHRRQDEGRALQYLWREHCLKAKGKATLPASLDDFDNIAPEDDRQDSKNISFVDFSKLAKTPPSPRRWAVDEWLIRGSLATLFGAGGHGKSLLMLQLATCVANGFDFMGLKVEQGNVIGLFCEDEADELERRQHSIFENLFIDPVEGSQSLYLDARPGKFNTLATFNAERLLKPTQLLHDLHKTCAELRPVLVILDNIAQMYSGGENIRHEVTQFCNALSALAKKHDCAVLLLGHTAKAMGSEYSGSTAWDAAVRTRLLMERQKDDLSVLRKAKANYSDHDQILMRHHAGVFVLAPSAVEMAVADRENIEPVILKALDVFTGRQLTTSHSNRARNYLVKMMDEEGLLEGFAKQAVHKVLMAMVDDGRLLAQEPLGWSDKNRHPVIGLKAS